MSDSISEPIHRMSARRNFLKTVGGMMLSLLAACVGKGLQTEEPTPSTIHPESMTPVPAKTGEGLTFEVEFSTPVDTAEIQPSPTFEPTTLSPKNSPTTQAAAVQNEECPAAYVITSLCLRDGACMEVCPVECIVPGYPVEEWPWFYIDPEVCIECGACVPECPHEAIFATGETPATYIARGGEYMNRIGLSGHYEGLNQLGNAVKLNSIRKLAEGEVIDLTEDICYHPTFFQDGPGYDALDQWEGW